MATTSNTTRAAAVLPLEVSAVKPKKRDLQKQQRRWGWLFMSPWLIGFTIFTAFPMIASLYFSFTNFDLNNPDKLQFIGLANWQKLFTDPLTLQSMGVTLRFALMAVPIGLIIPIGMATLLHSKYLRGKRIWTTLFYLPYMVPAVSGVFIWQAFLNTDTGWLNRILRLIGIANPPDWRYDESWILVSFLLIGLWGVGNAMLTILATMTGVPTELYEAASVDGANAQTKWFRITLPMISPVIFYNLVLSVIGVMQYFIVPYIITQGSGDPNHSAYFYNMHLYKTSFLYTNMGYGSALAWFMFIVALIFTIGLFATARRWVYYASGE
ncbi:MAG: carbohydrate ABC transporter permease [Aggregatilineales bacterium]